MNERELCELTRKAIDAAEILLQDRATLLDRDLVYGDSVAWCHYVVTAAEARTATTMFRSAGVSLTMDPTDQTDEICPRCGGGATIRFTPGDLT